MMPRNRVPQFTDTLTLGEVRRAAHAPALPAATEAQIKHGLDAVTAVRPAVTSTGHLAIGRPRNPVLTPIRRRRSALGTRQTWTLRDLRCAFSGACLTAFAVLVSNQMPVSVITGTALVLGLLPVLWLVAESAIRLARQEGGGR